MPAPMSAAAPAQPATIAGFTRTKSPPLSLPSRAASAAPPPRPRPAAGDGAYPDPAGALRKAHACHIRLRDRVLALLIAHRNGLIAGTDKLAYDRPVRGRDLNLTAGFDRGEDSAMRRYPPRRLRSRESRRAISRKRLSEFSPCRTRTLFSTGSSAAISTPSGAVFKSAKRRALTITRLSSDPPRCCTPPPRAPDPARPCSSARPYRRGA